ncbi:hypothetical protein PROCOU_01924 [Listeria rocourtiae FSL F6-920]|nr:hypothetical protein PROCOU_01924 [Listeria rocourtiae FSL F6-920]
MRTIERLALTIAVAIILAVMCVLISMKIFLLLGVLLVLAFLFKSTKSVAFFSLTLVAGVFFLVL